ncbi:hypothetical protein [Herbaspirillum rhizosphaerae]|uniref:hypothetical protein n=1 Tax=Herbaspirillum rhizosphaerae TaxID=346179 RepID=UPI000AB0F1EB|nr:hypothetical protein [Herbaspirillum rhizosphaerae]
MNIRIVVGLALCASLLVGCAAPKQKDIAFKSEVLTTSPAKVGIVMSEIPKADTYFPGADCLLCYMTASAANSSLTDLVRTLPNDDLATLKESVAEALNKKGVSTLIVKEKLDVATLPDGGPSGENTARKNFTSLKGKYGVDKLLVVTVYSLGFTRRYSSYFPSGDPRATVAAAAYIVDLTTNKYDWYYGVSETKSAEGGWDEPPKYPGLTNAYYQVLERAKDKVLLPLSK